MRILVTGGAGFIGSHLTDALIEQGHAVSVVDNLSTGVKENLNPRVKFYEIDILDFPGLEKVFKEEKPETVFHLAAQINVRYSLEDPVFDAENNILGSLNLIRLCRDYGVGRFIFSSTGGAIYGEAEQIPTPESYSAVPASPYGISKLTVERYLEIFENLYGLRPVSLRYSNVYGPQQNAKGEAGVIAIFIDKIMRGEAVNLFGSGEQTRDYVFVGDVVRANTLALERESRGIFNIGTGVETSVNRLIELLEKSAGKGIKIKKAPPIAGELPRSALDFSRAREVLGWEPEVSLESGIVETLKWFQKKKSSK